MIIVTSVAFKKSLFKSANPLLDIRYCSVIYTANVLVYHLLNADKPEQRFVKECSEVAD